LLTEGGLENLKISSAPYRLIFAVQATSGNITSTSLKTIINRLVENATVSPAYYPHHSRAKTWPEVKSS
jgi:hypothetical protein